MKILVVHNRYLQPGGEDIAVAAEVRLLRERGHEVELFETSNRDLSSFGGARIAAGTVWSRNGRAQVFEKNRRFAPDVVHVHNTFPRLSPSIYYAVARAGVVQTLHNFRLVCPAATLMRNGQPCEECVGRFALPAIRHGCYRGRSASFVSAAMLQTHRTLGTWDRRVDAYIALTAFTRDVFVRGGLPREKLHIKPNFVAPDPGVGAQRGRHFLYVGRFDEGKGIRVLMDAWRAMPAPVPLRLIGSGGLEDEVRAFAASTPAVEFVGHVSHERVIAELKSARALIAPMLWYENFPLGICEAMATGCPVIAADVANVRAILLDGAAALLFRRTDASALRAMIESVTESQLAHVAARARAEYEQSYTADKNYGALMRIYAAALSRKLVPA